MSLLNDKINPKIRAAIIKYGFSVLIVRLGSYDPVTDVFTDPVMDPSGEWGPQFTVQIVYCSPQFDNKKEIVGNNDDIRITQSVIIVPLLETGFIWDIIPSCTVPLEGLTWSIAEVEHYHTGDNEIPAMKLKLVL